ncbi:MAG: hypothetical protein JNJ73_10520 [Hyphomonadaceae bacterium]|nr:hypothetical protein [Hyphomonadaceae bacterium]
MIANRSMPRASVIPVLAYADCLAAADWLCAAFGFTIRIKIADHRVQLNVGEGAVVATNGPSRPASLMVRVDDLDAHHARAVAHGVEIADPPTTYPYGERQYTAIDFAGHAWKFSQSVGDVAPEDWGGTSGTL